MYKKYIRIAVDGPSGAGKSTIAKALAKKLKIDYIDTGAMYRAVGLAIIENKIDFQDELGISNLLNSIDIDFRQGNIFLNDNNVEDKIRTSEMAMAASSCSKLLSVREKLVAMQRKMGETKSVIMDGRDIGTNVFKDAEFKFFITASAEERANRRYLELQAKGSNETYESVLVDIKQRDENDMTRKLNPLTIAEDAEKVDTTNMKVEEVVEYLYRKIKGN